jgi:hypothetical protein
LQANVNVVTRAADKYGPLDESFWKEVVSRSNSLAALENVGRHLSNAGLILSDGVTRVALTLDAGTVRMGEPPDANNVVSLKADDGVWSKLLNADIRFHFALNPYVGGTMEISGNGLLISWSIPTVIMLFRVATSVWTGHPFKMPEYQL